MIFANRIGEGRPVGTRGGRGEGWGPCACPGGLTSSLGSVRSTGRIPTRTSTRPPHPPTAPLVPTGGRTPLPRFGRQHALGLDLAGGLTVYHNFVVNRG